MYPLIIVVLCAFRCLKASLLPASRHTDISFATSYSGNTDNPKFCEFFKLPTPENKLSSKTLQVNVWCQNADTEECLVRFLWNFSSIQNSRDVHSLH